MQYSLIFLQSACLVNLAERREFSFAWLGHDLRVGSHLQIPAGIRFDFLHVGERKLGTKLELLGCGIGAQDAQGRYDCAWAMAGIATPSMVNQLIERSRDEIGLPVGALGIQIVFCSGEPGASQPLFRHDRSYGMHYMAEDYCFRYDLVHPETKAPLELRDGAIDRKHTSMEDSGCWFPLPVMRRLADEGAFDLGPRFHGWLNLDPFDSCPDKASR